MNELPKYNLRPSVMWPHAGTWCVALAFGGVFLLLVFQLYPQFDFVVSNQFFTETPCPDDLQNRRCGQFLLSLDPFWNLVREIGHDVPRILIAATACHLAWLLMFVPGKTPADLARPMAALIAAILGPLVIVNLWLKEYWGRPRPLQTVEFGGEHPYVPPGFISGYCESNCSFVSGEAAAGFWLLALALYFRGMWRMAYMVLAVAVALGISVLRVGFGRHYVSDVIVAGVLVLSCIAFAIWLLQTKRGIAWLDAMCQYSNPRVFGSRR